MPRLPLPVLLGCLAALPAAAEPPRNRVDVGGFVNVDGPLRDDTGVGGFLQVGRAVSAEFALTAGYEVQHVLETTDHRVNVTPYWQVTPTLLSITRVAWGPSRSLVPRWELREDVEWQAWPALALLAGVRHLDYPESVVRGTASAHDAVTVGSAGVRIGAGAPWALTLTGGAAFHTGLDPGSGARIPWTGYGAGRLEVRVLPPLVLAAGGSLATESRRPFLPLAVSRLWTVTGTARWEVTETLALRVDVLHEDFQDEYTRNGVSTAVTLRF